MQADLHRSRAADISDQAVYMYVACKLIPIIRPDIYPNYGDCDVVIIEPCSCDSKYIATQVPSPQFKLTGFSTLVSLYFGKKASICLPMLSNC